MEAMKDADHFYEVERRAEHAARSRFRTRELQMSKTQKVPWHCHSRVQDTLRVTEGQLRTVLQQGWCRLLAVLVSSRPDVRERLTQHYATEMRLARGLAKDAESLIGYPGSRVRVLDASERARRRAQRIWQTLEELKHPVAEPSGTDDWSPSTTWERLRADASHLRGMSDVYLADVQVAAHDHPKVAGLLGQLHREAARDAHDLVWVLAQLDHVGVEASAARASS